MLETKRMILYPISDEEMQQLIDNESDPGMKQAYSEMLEGCKINHEKRIWNAIWFMQLKDAAKTIVGDFAFKGLGEDGMIEIGYGLREGFCGNGYMTEAVKAVTEWALTQEGVLRAEAETDDDNEASKRVLLNAGYVLNGVRGEEGPRFVYVGK